MVTALTFVIVIFVFYIMAAFLFTLLAMSFVSILGFQNGPCIVKNVRSPIMTNAKSICSHSKHAALRRAYIASKDRSMHSISMNAGSTLATPEKWNQFVLQCCGSWNSLWSTYNYMGDMEDETIATVDLQLFDNFVQHTHIIPLSSVTSSCDRCQDSYETKTIPVAQYSPGNLRR